MDYTRMKQILKVVYGLIAEDEKKICRGLYCNISIFCSQEEHIKNVTKEFCDWVASLGGDSNNIEESTITSLFASGYETKPALSVPIHVVELTNVPPELRMSATVPQQQQQSKNLPQEEKAKTKWVGKLKRVFPESIFSYK